MSKKDTMIYRTGSLRGGFVGALVALEPCQSMLANKLPPPAPWSWGQKLNSLSSACLKDKLCRRKISSERSTAHIRTNLVLKTAGLTDKKGFHTIFWRNET